MVVVGLKAEDAAWGGDESGGGGLFCAADGGGVAALESAEGDGALVRLEEMSCRTEPIRRRDFVEGGPVWRGEDWMGPRDARAAVWWIVSWDSMRFEFFIAARYLRAKRRQAVVGVITAISVIGVAAGVASLIIALAITNGMRRDLQERLVGSTSHVDLMRVAGDGIRDWRPLLARLRKVPHVVAAAPGLYGQVLISRGARSGGALIKGVIPADEKTVGDLLQSVARGRRRSWSRWLSRWKPTFAGSGWGTRFVAAAGGSADCDWAGFGGDDWGEGWGWGVGDESAGRVDAAGAGAAVSEVSGSGDLQVGVLSV